MEYNLYKTIGLKVGKSGLNTEINFYKSRNKLNFSY